MIPSRAARNRRLGMAEGELEGKPYARFWNPVLAPLPEHAREALAHGPVAEPLLPPFEEAAASLETPGAGTENGFCLARGGGFRVAILTEMPGVSPAMWDWWFGWHSEEPQRYKLWHPRAHVYAEWRTPGAADLRDRARYVGRASYVDEYVGSALGSYLIRFVPPREFGLDEARLADSARATAICARVGFSELPFDFGRLLHCVEAVPGGATMRSRFWIGGPHAEARRGGPAGRVAVEAAKRILRPGAADAAALLVHCSQEMSHLASFLPALYAELGET